MMDILRNFTIAAIAPLLIVLACDAAPKAENSSSESSVYLGKIRRGDTPLSRDQFRDSFPGSYIDQAGIELRVWPGMTPLPKVLDGSTWFLEVTLPDKYMSETAILVFEQLAGNMLFLTERVEHGRATISKGKTLKIPFMIGSDTETKISISLLKHPDYNAVISYRRPPAENLSIQEKALEEFHLRRYLLFRYDRDEGFKPAFHEENVFFNTVNSLHDYFVNNAPRPLWLPKGQEIPMLAAVKFALKAYPSRCSESKRVEEVQRLLQVFDQELSKRLPSIP